MRQVCGEARRDEAVRSPGIGGSSLARRHVVKADGSGSSGDGAAKSRSNDHNRRDLPRVRDGYSPFVRRRGGKMIDIIAVMGDDENEVKTPIVISNCMDSGLCKCKGERSRVIWDTVMVLV
ncbi:hypothetical protein PG987_010124 [Apiospora arundinis]